MRRASTVVAALSLTAVILMPAATFAQMPDPRQMAGVPLPVVDLAVGTVTVRVVRGAMTNPIANQAVELLGAGAPARAQTNEAGRAEFTGLAPGTKVKAVAVVDGERLESQEFDVPRTGGVRLALVAGLGAAAPPAAAPPAAAAQQGVVVLGDQTRFVIEMGDEALNVFSIIEVLNAAAGPVQTPAPLVFDLPEAAQGPGMLEGSSPQAKLEGRRVVVAGPFPPGSTIVQFAYSLPFGGGTVTIAQALPANLDHVAVVVQKIGDMRLQSPQLAEQREMPAEGQMYIAARGPLVRAGDTLALTISGLPHPPAWPLNVALVMAAAILVAGAWVAFKARAITTVENARRQRLHARRDRLFDELAALEARQRERAIEPGPYTVRRGELVAALERIYAEMDEDAAA